MLDLQNEQTIQIWQEFQALFLLIRMLNSKLNAIFLVQYRGFPDVIFATVIAVVIDIKLMKKNKTKIPIIFFHFLGMKLKNSQELTK